MTRRCAKISIIMIPRKTSTESPGIDFFGYTTAAVSLYQAIVLLSAGYPYYAYLHQEYTPRMILVRYVFSWLIKALGLVVGIGLLARKEFFRKLAIASSVLTIVTVHLKHTHAAYLLHVQQLDRSFEALYGGLPDGFTFVSVLGPALLLQRSIDVVFALALIFYLTRAHVKQQFVSHH